MKRKKYYCQPVSETVGVLLESNFVDSQTDKDDFPGITDPGLGFDDIDWAIF